MQIDWDNYTVVESEDYEDWDWSQGFEEVREEIDRWLEKTGSVPVALEELLLDLNNMEEEQNGTDQG